MDSCDNENEDENDIVEENETEEEDITDNLLIMQMLGML